MGKLLKPICRCMAILILVGTTACSGTKKSDDEGGVTTEVTTSVESGGITAEIEPINPELENLDYGGQKVVFLTRTKSVTPAQDTLLEICAEELNNEPINDAIYNRNLYVEELLNIEIEEVRGTIKELIPKDIASGDGEYDIVADSVYHGPPLIEDGHYYNLLDNGIDTYLDITKPWWSQKWISENMLGDRLYCITGSLALTLRQLMYVTYYNKTIAESNGIENLYDVVERGDWTIDYEAELVSGLYIDLNGDSTRDKEDSYGLLTNHYECNDIYWSCFNMDFFAKDTDGWFYMNADQEKLSAAIEKVYNLVYNNQGTYDFGDSRGFVTACTMFTQGQSLFASLHLHWAENEEFRNMQDTYGILPEPKFDTNQENYYTYAHDQYSVFFVPITVKNTELCGAVLEAMCYESYRTLDPAYFNLALKGRYANDQETRRMLDIVVEGFTVDASWVYGKAMGEPAASVFRLPIYNADISIFSSNFKKYSKSVPIGLRELRSKIESFDY